MTRTLTGRDRMTALLRKHLELVPIVGDTDAARERAYQYEHPWLFAATDRLVYVHPWALREIARRDGEALGVVSYRGPNPTVRIIAELTEIGAVSSGSHWYRLDPAIVGATLPDPYVIDTYKPHFNVKTGPRSWL